MIGMSGSFLAGSVSEKRWVFPNKNLIVIENSRNYLARNIVNIFLPLRCEIFVGEKRNQVETAEHVFIICK